jgi:rhamnose utilization protein RhaD (predicted bifunctional aldolase and dehydrogenase)
MIMNTSNIFTKHPNEVRMTYLQHTRFALMLSFKTLTCAIASLIHAFLPFLFVTHTSTTIRKLQNIFDQREKELAAPGVMNERKDARAEKIKSAFQSCAS